MLLRRNERPNNVRSPHTTSRHREPIPLSWAAAHLWTVRDDRIARWETHLDLAAARRTLDVDLVAQRPRR